MIKLPIEKVDRIYHLSDIHIRNVKRHKEYRSVFKKVYKEIAKNKEMQSETGTRVQDPTDGMVSTVVTPPTQQEPDRHKTN